MVAVQNVPVNLVKERAAVTESQKAPSAPVIIKKYANRRLYNTATSSYVTLDHLAQMVKDGTEFVVYDAKSSEEITRSVLTQIIFEEEGKGQNLLPIRFLRQLIGFYGKNMQGIVPNYLEMSMETLTRNQESIREQFAKALGTTTTPFRQFDEVTRQNLAMFEKAMSVFTPFTGTARKEEPADTSPPAPPAKPGDEDLSALKSQLTRMQEQIDSLTKK